MKVRLVLTLIAVAIFTLTSYSQTTRWGGKGNVSIETTKIDSKTAVAIRYNMIESNGSGTGDFRCEVTTPDGIIFISKKQSTYFRNGGGSATFYFPQDFSGNDDVKASLKSHGKYHVQCYWYIDGFGVNGKTAAGIGAFVVK